MRKYSKLVVNESAEELKILLRKQTKSKNIDRLRSLLFIKLNKFITRQELADYLGYHIRTMERWLSKYGEGGLDKMLLAERLERKSHLVDSKVHGAISKRVNDPPTGFSSYVEVKQWLSTNYDLEIEYNTIRSYLIRNFKTKIKQPRKSHIKKDDEAVEAFFKTT
ncbi:MAG: transposase [Saprospiraceae bacterium]|jgi:transposase|tara:strand:- start:598 stop:1092 length:495 start_codon:yes stop_codon:yes gene_type:complete